LTVTDEDAEINAALASIQYQYPSLTLEEMREIFDETYDRLVAEDELPERGKKS